MRISEPADAPNPAIALWSQIGLPSVILVARRHLMKQIHIAIALIAAVFGGCATEADALRRHQEHLIAQGHYFLATSNAPAGAFYELGVYVIAPDDTMAKIGSRFQVSVADIMSVNPGLNPTRLYIGQKIRIYERKKE